MASTTTISKSEDCQRQYFHCPKALQDPIEIVLMWLQNRSKSVDKVILIVQVQTFKFLNSPK